jgi:hypothetical protein
VQALQTPAKTNQENVNDFVGVRTCHSVFRVPLKINSNIPKESGINKTSFKEPRAEN